SREMLQTGGLERLMRDDAVVGVTSNPTIFQKAISQGDLYDEQIRDCLDEHDEPKEIFWRLAETDIGNACDLLRPVWDATGGKDGYVSIEVDPNLAGDTEATIAEARRLHEQIDKPNLYVKIPATKAGLPAIEEMIASGKNINVTLIFSLERYAEVAEAFIRGLERLAETGGDLSRVASVASFFVSRVDTEADKRLDEMGGHDELKGKLAVANAKLAYQRYKETFSGPRWDAGARGGRRPEVRGLLLRAARRHRRQPRRARGRVAPWLSQPSSSSSGSGPAIPRSGPARAKSSGSAGSTSRCGCASGSTTC